MRFIGADPDLHTLSLAAVDENGRLREVLVIKNDKALTGRLAAVELIGRMVQSAYSLPCLSGKVEAMAVESQEIAYTARTGANPRSLLLLAPISGALVFIGKCAEAQDVYLPTPQKWKGSVKKQSHHGRIFRKIGMEYQERSGYCCPMPRYEKDLDYVECFNGNLNIGDWKHITDSIGLAMFARTEYYKARHKEEALKNA